MSVCVRACLRVCLCVLMSGLRADGWVSVHVFSVCSCACVLIHV